jgi:hypothetical protein
MGSSVWGIATGHAFTGVSINPMRDRAILRKKRGGPKSALYKLCHALIREGMDSFYLTKGTSRFKTPFDETKPEDTPFF